MEFYFKVEQTARMGAVVLGSVYVVFALLWIRRIIHEPLVYDRWGNFFEILVQGRLTFGACFPAAMHP